MRRAPSLGVGFIGYGVMGRAHAHALRTLDHLGLSPRPIRFVSVAGRTSERVQRAADELGFERWTTSWHAVVEDHEVDVVAVLGSNRVHAPASIAALELGKPVLCEKPLARSGAEALEMLQAAEASLTTHSCAFNYRFVPAVRLARNLIASGRLGALRHFRAAYLQDWAASPTTERSWRFEAAEANGAVADYSHIVDLLRHLGGEPVAVSARTARFVDERPDPERPGRLLPVEVEDAYGAVLSLSGGALATLEASRLATGWKGRQVVEVIGSDGALWWNMEDLNRLHVFVADDEQAGIDGFRDVLVTERGHPFLEHWWGAGHILGWEHTFVHQWRDFLRAAVEHRPVPDGQASFEDGYRAAVVCDAILAAAAEGREVAVEGAEAAVR